jgi:hypothetical protein
LTVRPIRCKPVSMNDAKSPTLFVSVVAELAARGVRLTARPGEYCVNFRDGSDATAYVTDDLSDAIEHGRALARAVHRPADAAAPAQPARAKRRRRPPAMTPKARHGRVIKQHNRRLRARMLRQQREELPR